MADAKTIGGLAAAVVAGALGGAALLGDAEAAEPVLSEAQCAIVEQAHPGQTCAQMVESAARRLLKHSQKIVKAKRGAKLDWLKENRPVAWAKVKAEADKVTDADMKPVEVEEK